MRYAKGFTLIELLVVTSIISLLSSIVFSSVLSARIRAENAYTAIQVRQYMIAIQNFYLDHNRLPDPAPNSDNTVGGVYCVGASYCVLPSDVPSNNKLNAEFLQYMPSLPNINLRPLASSFGSTNPFQGLQYGCNASVGLVRRCLGAQFIFVLAGTDQDCRAASGAPNEWTSPPGQVTGFNSSGNTYCLISIVVDPLAISP